MKTTFKLGLEWFGTETPLTPQELWEGFFTPTQAQEVFENYIRLKNTEGVDRISPFKFQKALPEQSSIISRKCYAGTYKFSPYLQQLRPKGRGRPPRALSIPTVRDRIVLKLLTEYLQYTFPKNIAQDLPNTIVRKLKSKVLESDANTRYIRLDIKEFYDSIDQSILIQQIKRTSSYAPFLSTLSQALKNPTLEANYSAAQKKAAQNIRGVPQGLPVSNILAEIYLDSFDKRIRSLCIEYYRFVDDIVILCHKDNVPRIWSFITYKFGRLRLKRNTDKSTKKGEGLSDIDFDFLGYRFTRDSISVREGSYKKFLHSILGIITKYKNDNSPTDAPNQKKLRFIFDLNERITGAVDGSKRFGWAFFFSEIDDLTMLNQIDRVIETTLGRLRGFSKDDLSKVKRVTRAYYEAKFSPHRGYILNYDKYDTPEKKLDFLVLTGVLKSDPNSSYTKEKIEEMFELAKHKRLLKLEHDLAMFY